MQATSSIKVLKPNPKIKANCLASMCFGYTIPTFRQGWKHGFTEDDLYEIMPEFKSKLLGDKMEAAWNEEKKRQKPSLFRALRKVYLKYFVGYCFMLISLQLVRISQAVSLYYLMYYYEKDQTHLSKSHAYLCVTFVVLPSFILVICMHSYMLSLQHLGMKARIGCCSLVYRKCLKLSRLALEHTTTGQLVNLLSNDVKRFDFVCLQLPFLFDIPVEVIVTLILLYYFCNIQPFSGVGLFVLQIPIQIILGSKFSSIRSKTATRTDERVRLMNEILSGIQVIKMHTWEQSFAQLIQEARRTEIHQIRSSCNIKSFLLSFAIITSRIAVFLALLTYVLTGNELTPKYVFLVVALFGMMRQSMTVALPNAISQIAEARVSIHRLEKFLLSDEIIPPEKRYNYNWMDTNATQNETASIILQSVCAKWSPKKEDNVLTDITFKLEKDDMMAVIGMVGSGKSSLFNLLLKELPINSGKLMVTGVVSYASQEPWLFVGSIKQNILFGSEYNHIRYNQVLTVCALKRDLSLLPYGDDTLIGERGISISGGQRARINLARAIYKEADTYLLDDPLSAVDTKVGNLIFEECIMQFLKGKCVILTTHQFQYLKEMPIILMLDAGRINFLGGYNDMIKARPDLVYRLEEKMSNDDLTTSNSRGQEEPEMLENSRLLVPAPRESFSTGSVKREIYRAYISAGGNACIVCVLGMLFFITQFFASSCDYYITYWVNAETVRLTDGNAVDTMGNKLQPTNVYIFIYTVIIALTVIITLIRSISYFALCMKASVNLHKQMFDAVVNAPMAFFHKHPSGRILNRFSKDMATIDDLFPYVTMDTFQIGLSVLGVIIVTIIVNPFTVFPIAIILVVFYFLRIYYLRTSRNIKRLEGVTKSPVFTQMNTTMQGLTTIRAFKAEEMSKNDFDNIQDSHSSAWEMSLSTSRAFGFVRRTLTNIIFRFRDALCRECKGCLARNSNEILSRPGKCHCADSCGSQNPLQTQLIASLLRLQKSDMLPFFSDIYGANVGLAITQSLTLTGMFQWGMRQWSEMDNCMTSVERVYEYTQIHPEQCVKPPKIPPPYWPSAGAIEFKHVYLKYAHSEPFVLRDLNFKVKPNQKIGIVGRTGAGKSSIISSLFQLAETKGQIIIDDIDIQTIPLKNLRSKIAIIPQEPVLFAGSLRKNLDPFDEHSDTLLWKAIEEVALLPAVLKLPAGLASLISEGGANFSVGQRQLLCLARAIVRSNRILILDEATANVDPQTDDLIQTTIKEKFRFCTVLTIAHRLHTILDSDKVLVMEAGRTREFGYSYVLLQNTEGIFYSLVKNSGPRMQEEIMQIAKENYLMRAEKGTSNPRKPLDPEDTLTPIPKEDNKDNENDESGSSGT